jgi:hypothetical protein
MAPRALLTMSASALTRVVRCPNLMCLPYIHRNIVHEGW